ncbi:MAG: hypothetical protein AAGC93_28185 [Cyanobacteria bacterium P01_F01_bin.53]
MASLTIRNISDNAVHRLQNMARTAAARGLETYVREVLEEHSKKPLQESYKRVQKLQAMVKEKHGILPDSTPLIREDRDKRG